jgi:GntR family transcriptional regulator/MocR family aminotransferase
VHLLVWLQDVPPQQLGAFIDYAARAGVGLYSVTPYYLMAPPRAGLLLGYAALTEEEIRAGVQRLAAVLDHGEWRCATAYQEDRR